MQYDFCSQFFIVIMPKFELICCMKVIKMQFETSAQDRDAQFPEDKKNTP